MGESTNTLDANGVIVEKSTYSSYHTNIIQSKSGEGAKGISFGMARNVLMRFSPLI